MPIRRVLMLCLIAFTLVFTGPLARGLSSTIQSPPADIVLTAGLGSPAGSSTVSKQCQRGAMAWTSCAADIGFPPSVRRVATPPSVTAYDRSLAEIVRGLNEGRFFRPPRLS